MKSIVYWEWEEAFNKFGFGDGDGPNFTREVEEFLCDIGWSAELDSWGIHNFMIMDITGPDGEKPMAKASIGYDCPRTYLPQELVEQLDERFPAG